jgi:hypothetical protein
MAEPQVTNSFINPLPIGNCNHAQAQARGVRGLSANSGSYARYSTTRYGLVPFQDDSQATGGGAAARLPAAGVPAQAPSAVAINKKP